MTTVQGIARRDEKVATIRLSDWEQAVIAEIAASLGETVADEVEFGGKPRRDQGRACVLLARAARTRKLPADRAVIAALTRARDELRTTLPGEYEALVEISRGNRGYFFSDESGRKGTREEARTETLLTMREYENQLWRLDDLVQQLEEAVV